jgi:hypothetical protein
VEAYATSTLRYQQSMLKEIDASYNNYTSKPISKVIKAPLLKATASVESNV